MSEKENQEYSWPPEALLASGIISCSNVGFIPKNSGLA